jgi:hypothetical protein
MKFVREQFLLATTAQNLKRLIFQIVELAERSPSLGRHHEQQLLRGNLLVVGSSPTRPTSVSEFSRADSP